MIRKETMIGAAIRYFSTKPKPKMKPIELKTPPEQTQTITRAIFDIVKEHDPLTIAETWEKVQTKAHPSVAAHVLFDLEGVERSSSTESALLLIDIAGCDMEEKKDEEDSTMNEREAQVAMAHAKSKRLVQSGVQASDIGIITPYAAQVVLLKVLESKEDKLKDLAISTVDGFQGREKEAIIISMVRSNSKKEVGFLKDNRRMNVAVTRARRHCCIVCDTETVSSDCFLKRLIEHFEEHAEYLSASEFLNE